MQYSASKSIHLTPDIVECEAGAYAPMYDLIIGKQTVHDSGAVLDFNSFTASGACISQLINQASC